MRAKLQEEPLIGRKKKKRPPVIDLGETAAQYGNPGREGKADTT